MCDPLAATSIALTAAGGLMQGISANQQASATNNARKQADERVAGLITSEQVRQDKYRQQSFDELQKGNDLLNINNQNETKDSMAKNLAQQYQLATNYNPVADQPLGLVPGSSGNKVISDTFSKIGGKTNDYLSKQADAKAAIDAWQNLNLANNINLGRYGQNIGLIKNKAAGSKNTLDTEIGFANRIAANNLYNAQDAGGTIGTAGSLIGGLGSAASKGATWGSSNSNSGLIPK